MKNYSTILCLTSIQDTNSGLYSFINCIDSAVISAVPRDLPGFEIFTKWVVSQDRSNLTASVICHYPDDAQDVLRTVEGFEAKSGIFGLTVTVEKFVVNQPGDHYVQVVIHDKEEDKYFYGYKHPIIITLAPPKKEDSESEGKAEEK
ncbi:hypothetical protein DSECCO2_390690 [anaerobic digester metagenome]